MQIYMEESLVEFIGGSSEKIDTRFLQIMYYYSFPVSVCVYVHVYVYTCTYACRTFNGFLLSNNT